MADEKFHFDLKNLSKEAQNIVVTAGLKACAVPLYNIFKIFEMKSGMRATFENAETRQVFEISFKLLENEAGQEQGSGSSADTDGSITE